MSCCIAEVIQKQHKKLPEIKRTYVRWEMFYVDILGPFIPDVNGNKYAVVFAEDVSTYVIVILIKITQ